MLSRLISLKMTKPFTCQSLSLDQYVKRAYGKTTELITPEETSCGF